MSIEVTYPQHARVRIQTFSGAISAEEYVASMRALVGSDRFDPSMDALVDLRGVTSTTVRAEHVRAVRDLMASPQVRAPRKVAFVVGNAVTLGYARAYQMLMEGGPEEIEIFEDLQEARGWLGLGGGADA